MRIILVKQNFKAFLLSKYKVLTIAFGILLVVNGVFYFITGSLLFRNLVLNLFCITLAYNISTCYIYKISFFSKDNLCFVLYNFITLLIARSVTICLMSFLVSNLNHNHCEPSTKKKIEFYFNGAYKGWLDCMLAVKNITNDLSKSFVGFIANDFYKGCISLSFAMTSLTLESIILFLDFIFKLPILKDLNMHALLNYKGLNHSPNIHLGKYRFYELSGKHVKFYRLDRSLITSFNTGAKFITEDSSGPIIKALGILFCEKNKLLCVKLINLLSETKVGKGSSNIREITSNNIKSLINGNGLTSEFLDMISTVKNKQCRPDHPDYVNNENITVNVMRIEDDLVDKSDANIEKTVLGVIKPPFESHRNLAFFKTKDFSAGLCDVTDANLRYKYTNLFAPYYNQAIIWSQRNLEQSGHRWDDITKTYVKHKIINGVPYLEGVRFCPVGLDEYLSSGALKSVACKVLNKLSDIRHIPSSVIPAHPNGIYNEELGHSRNLISYALELPGISSIHNLSAVNLPDIGSNWSDAYKAYCQNIGAHYFTPAHGYSSWSEERGKSGIVDGQFRFLTKEIGIAKYSNKQGVTWTDLLEKAVLTVYPKLLAETNPFIILMKDKKIAFFLFKVDWHSNNGFLAKNYMYNGLIGLHLDHKGVQTVPQLNIDAPQGIFYTFLRSRADDLAIHTIYKFLSSYQFAPQVSGVINDLSIPIQFDGLLPTNFVLSNPNLAIANWSSTVQDGRNTKLCLNKGRYVFNDV